MFCNVGFAETKVLECLWWDNYYDGEGKWASIENKWKLKIDDTNMHIYDYTYESYYPNPYPIVLNVSVTFSPLDVLYSNV